MIYHEGKLNISQKDLELYLDILQFSVNNWIKNNAHELVVFMPHEVDMEILSDNITQNKLRQGWGDAFKQAIAKGNKP